MNVMKLVSGIVKMVLMFSALILSMPYWILLFAYDMGSPKDDEDRCGEFLHKILGV